MRIFILVALLLAGLAGVASAQLPSPYFVSYSDTCYRAVASTYGGKVSQFGTGWKSFHGLNAVPGYYTSSIFSFDPVSTATSDSLYIIYAKVFWFRNGSLVRAMRFYQGGSAYDNIVYDSLFVRKYPLTSKGSYQLILQR